MNRGSATTNRASGRSCANVAKAALISWPLVALTTRIGRRMACAAASTSRKLGTESTALDGLASTATRAAAGTNSRNSSNRLACNSLRKKLMPVALPPGRARLATRPNWTGSPATAKTTGMVVVAALAAKAAAGEIATITAAFRRTNSAASAGSRSHLILGPAVFYRHVLAFGIAGVPDALAKSAQPAVVPVGRLAVQDADQRHCLLRPCGNRHRRRRATEQRYELAPPCMSGKEHCEG